MKAYDRWNRNVLLAGALALAALSLLACGSDSSSGVDEEIPSGYTPPADSANAAVVFTGLDATVSGSLVFLQGKVAVDYAKDSSATQIDSIVFGVNPLGPTVSTTAILPKGLGSVDLATVLAPSINLATFDSCGTYTVYVTAYVKGKPRTSSVSFAKDASYCAESSSSAASSSSGYALSSTTVTLSAQKISGPNAVDLDAGTTYTGVEAIAEAKDKVDLIFGYDEEEGTYYLVTPKGTSVLSDYAGAANASYGGAVYDYASFAVAPSQVKSSSQIVLDARDKADYVELLSNGYVIVTSDLYDASTGEGLYLVRVPALSGGSRDMAALTVWSVAP